MTSSSLQACLQDDISEEAPAGMSWGGFLIIFLTWTTFLTYILYREFPKCAPFLVSHVLNLIE